MTSKLSSRKAFFLHDRVFKLPADRLQGEKFGDDAGLKECVVPYSSMVAMRKREGSHPGFLRSLAKRQVLPPTKDPNHEL